MPQKRQDTAYPIQGAMPTIKQYKTVKGRNFTPSTSSEQTVYVRNRNLQYPTQLIIQQMGTRIDTPSSQ